MSDVRRQQFRLAEQRTRRQMRVRKGIEGTAERPRLAVFRSHKHFFCQIIDDLKGVTLAAASTRMKDLRPQLKTGGDRKAAEAVGAKIAELAKSKGITKVVLDRRHYLYHGRVKTFADAARKAGLKF